MHIKIQCSNCSNTFINVQTKKVAVNSKQDQIDFNGAKNIFVKLSSNKVNIMLFTVNKIIYYTFHLFPGDSEVSPPKF